MLEILSAEFGGISFIKKKRGKKIKNTFNQGLVDSFEFVLS